MATSKSTPFLYTSLLITTIVIQLGSGTDGSGRNCDATTALGITDTCLGDSAALNTVFSLLHEQRLAYIGHNVFKRIYLV